MRASQVEAFLETELMQGRNAISLTLVLSICRAYLEVKYWLGDGGEPLDTTELRLLSSPFRYLDEPHSTGGQTGRFEGTDRSEGVGRHG